MKIQNPLIRLKVTLISTTGTTKLVGKLYLRQFDFDWGPLESILSEVWSDATDGEDYDDAFLPEIGIDPDTGLEQIDSHSCLTDFDHWAQVMNFCNEHCEAEDTLRFLQVVVDNARKLAYGDDPQLYVVLVQWDSLIDNTEIDASELFGE